MVLRRADPLASDLDDLPVDTEGVVERPSSDAIACLQHDHRAALGDEVASGGEAGQPGPNDHHIGAANPSA